MLVGGVEGVSPYQPLPWLLILASHDFGPASSTTLKTKYIRLVMCAVIPLHSLKCVPIQSPSALPTTLQQREGSFPEKSDF